MNKFADFIARNQYSHMIIHAVLLLVILPLSMDIFPRSTLPGARSRSLPP